MNRAILIVICDFLVSSMLSMMTGMVPSGSAETGAGASLRTQVSGAPGLGLDAAAAATLLMQLRENETRIVMLRTQLLAEQAQKGLSSKRENELDKLTQQLAEARVRAEHLEKMLSLTRSTTGRLTPAELAAQRDAAKSNAEKNSIRLEDTRERLSDVRNHLSDTRNHLSDARNELADARNHLADANAQIALLKKERDAAIAKASESTVKSASSEARLRDTATRLAVAEEELKKKDARLAQTRETLAARQETLTRTQRELSDALARTGVLTEQGKAFERDLSFLRGKLSTAERDLAESRSQNELDRRTIETRELERNDAQRQLADLQRTLKNTVGELSKVRRELTEKGERLAVTAQKLRTAEHKLSSNVQASYAESVVRLNVQISEWRLMKDQKGFSTFYLPFVQVGGKTVIPASFRNFAGDGRIPINFIEITELKLTLSGVDRKSAKNGRVLTAPLIAGADGEPAFIAIEADPAGLAKPLKALTAQELKKRGVQDLYLFKRTSFGKQSAALGGRCSIDFSSRGCALYVRNAGRSASELKAEPGDFVLTREGEYVGTVIGLENRSAERFQEARCFVFPDRFSWQETLPVPVTKASGARYYENFAKAMRQLEQVIRRRK